MKQYRITAKDFAQTVEPDCVLAPNDPAQALIAQSAFGGLGGIERYHAILAERHYEAVKLAQQKLQS